MRITSEKVFIEKIKEDYRLNNHKEYKRTIYYMTKKGEDEIIVAIGLIRKLEDKKIVDSNLDVHLP